VTLAEQATSEPAKLEGNPDVEAEIYAALGEVQYRAGNAAASEAATARAIELHEQKGNAAAAARVSALAPLVTARRPE